MTVQPTLETLRSLYQTLTDQKMTALFDGDDATFETLDSQCSTLARDIERLSLNPNAVLVGTY